MLRKLRIQLTLLYLLAGAILVSVVGAWLYYRMANYFQSTTDLALKYRLAMELRLLAAPVSPELEAAEQDFIQQSRSEGYFSTPTPSPVPVDDEESSEMLTPSSGGVPVEDKIPGPTKKPTSSSKPDDTEEETIEGESNLGGIKMAKILQVTLIPTLAVTPVAIENHPEPDMDDLYFSEITSIFVLNLDMQGGIIPSLNQSAVSMTPDLNAVISARDKGTDLRNTVMSNGIPFRLLTYKLPDGYPAEFIQVGRPVDEHTRLLKQYLADLIVISSILLVLLGIASWWLAGKTLLPTQKSLELQQAFVANASHELRTPLTLIRASTELAQRSLPDGEPKLWLNDVLNDVDYMSKLVEDLLLLSRLDHQRIKLDLAPVQVDMLLKEVARQMELLTQGKNITVALDTVPAVVTADAERLKQVLWILIDNAINHSPAGGKITLVSKLNPRQVEIQVQDSGVGIQPEDMPHIFERFYKARNSAKKTRGAGLGLSIADSLMRAQNGKIGLASQVGIGTTASIYFNLSVSGPQTKS
jgi:signal transduction histidine kinase